MATKKPNKALLGGLFLLILALVGGFMYYSNQKKKEEELKLQEQVEPQNPTPDPSLPKWNQAGENEDTGEPKTLVSKEEFERRLKVARDNIAKDEKWVKGIVDGLDVAWSPYAGMEKEEAIDLAAKLWLGGRYYYKA